MSEPAEIVLTNDDGIDSLGLSALYESLSELASVTVVAPAGDRSAVGRSISSEVDVVDHELGYAVEGTPADCVVAALGELGPVGGPDLVVSGCNRGANLGEYSLGRSGTIGAAVEAAFAGVPAIATSLYVPVEAGPFEEVDLGSETYVEASRATRYLVAHALEGELFEHVDYLNVNAPVSGEEPAPIELTRPSPRYEMDATADGERITLINRIWERMSPETLPDPAGTDRRAVVEGRVSVTPLSIPQATVDDEGLGRLVDGYLEWASANR